ncbi:unnamed protein product [Schistosoma margrebowiei]|uniref:Uncharacterized protein n=1 Tax=Schistosoma margrebowiei TaxID=48269 RepID=A0A183N1F8_9TREM|nr:unnamed protein product [Schistosoma margrebowiei]
MAIKQIKSSKAAGPDNIPAEALKADVAAAARILHILFSKIKDEEQVPKDWKEGLLIRKTKKGDLSNCDNYRGITVLSIPRTVFNRTEFRKDRSCTDRIATLRIIVEQQLNGIHHSTSTSLTTKRHLIAWRRFGRCKNLYISGQHH